MNKLRKEINKIKKSYFSFADLRKISHLNDVSLRVTLTRMLKAGELKRLSQGCYCLDESKVDFPKMALEIYRPSYLSFEWVLGYYGILSQKSYSITLATMKRARRIELGDTTAEYHHLREDLFFAYVVRDGYLLARKEKAFLDQAYLSLNGYARFDAGEMNLDLLDKKRMERYLKKFRSKRLERLLLNNKIL